MGSIVLYIMEWAFALIVLLTIYKAVFSGTTFNRFNRFYLLGATVLSALLPLLHITIPEKTPVVGEMAIEQMEFAQELSETFILIGNPQMMAVVTSKPEGHSMWAVILVCMYSAYVLMLLVGWSRSIIRAKRFLRGKPRRRISRTVWLVMHDEDFGPFSWMNYIVISDTENGFARRASLRHELSHVKLLHSVDLVFLLACTIVNPVCWLVLQEIKIVHEYEADNEVVNRYGIRNGDYQKLLIMRTVGAEAYALASSFNLNIKKRIIMLNKNQTRKRRLMWLLLLIPLLGITSVLFARTEKAVNTDNVLSVSASSEMDEKEAIDNTTFQVSGKVVDEKGNAVASADFIVIADVSGHAALTKCSSDKNGEFVYSTSKGELVTVSKQGYIPIKVSFETPSSDLTITLKSNQIQSNVTPPAIESADKDSESQSMVVAQTLKAGDVIHGLVANAETGITIPMVNVYEKDAKNRIVAHALTDIEGNFRMKIVDPNDVLIISHPEYAEAQRPIANGPISIKKLISDDEPAMVIDVQPEFPGGTAALLQFLSSNIKYPAECRDSSIEGRVIVSFVIGKDGAICEPEVVKSVHPLLDAEALRVISLMPNWVPGMQQGKPVRVKYSVPITFRLDGSSGRSTPEWIYLYNARYDADDDNVASLLMSVANSNEDLGSLNTPEVRAFIDAYRSAQKEAQAITVKYQEELQAMDSEIQKKTEDYAKQHDDLSESMRASYEQEITRARQEQQQKYQEGQAKVSEWVNEMTNKLESQIKAAWKSVSKNGAYICMNMQTGIPDESIVVTPDNLESAVKDLFDGLRNEVIIKFSPENAQRMRDLLSGKYSTKSVFYMNVR
jgi:TonB family protein